MGIYIRLTSPIRVSLLTWALSRIDYCQRSIEYFEQARMFLPEKMRIWKNASSEALGGVSYTDIKISSLHIDAEKLRSLMREAFYRDELFNSIIVFEGIWDFNDMKLAGFFSVNNEYMWHEAYHDIEIDAYGKGEIEDLADHFWRQNLIETLAPSFIFEVNREARGKLIKPSEIYFSIGAPEYGEIDNLLTLHLKDWHDFIGFLYSKLRNDKASWIKNKIAPIDRHFFLSSIRGQKIVEIIFKKILEEALMVEQVGKSVTYIAKDRESFARFYQKFKEEVFRSAATELPEADTLKKNIKKGLEKVETLV